MWRVESGMRKAPKFVIARALRARGNLEKALPIYTECRRTQSLSNLTVAALTAQPLAALPPYGCGVPFTGSERLVKDHSTAQGHWCTAAPP